MAFIAIDENIREPKWYKRIAAWGFDLICARPGEMDYDFITRAIEHECVGVLSDDTDIPTILDRLGSKMKWGRTPRDLLNQLRPRSPN